LSYTPEERLTLGELYSKRGIMAMGSERKNSNFLQKCWKNVPFRAK